MKPPIAGPPSLLDRMDWQEKQGRTFTMVASVAVVLLGSVVLMAQVPQAARTVRAQAFVLEDPVGRERAMLTTTASGIAALLMFDAQGNPRAELAVAADGRPGLILYDETGNARTQLYLEPFGLGQLQFVEAGGRVRARVGMLPTGEPILNFNDRAGQLRATLLIVEGSPRLEFYEVTGRVRLSVP